MSKRYLLFLLAVIGIVTTVLLPVFISEFEDGFVLANGYSTLWLIILYLLGGCIRKYGLFDHIKTSWLIASYFISGLMSWFSRMFISFVTIRLLGAAKYEEMWISYLSVFIAVSAVSLLLLFKRLRFNRFWVKVISILSPLAFSVYLIHTNHMIFDNVLKDAFVWISDCPIYFSIPIVIGVSMLIYLICSMIDLVRHYLFILLRLKDRLSALENKIRSRLIDKTNP